MQHVLWTPEAARYLGLAASTLEKLRLTGEGPRFIRIGIRAVGYSTADLDAWLGSRARLSTSDWKDRRREGTSGAPHHEGTGEGV
jgi:predicted DNA-binding transcriptional regulator AlpA